MKRIQKRVAGRSWMQETKCYNSISIKNPSKSGLNKSAEDPLFLLAYRPLECT